MASFNNQFLVEEVLSHTTSRMIKKLFGELNEIVGIVVRWTGMIGIIRYQFQWFDLHQFSSLSLSHYHHISHLLQRFVLESQVIDTCCEAGVFEIGFIRTGRKFCIDQSIDQLTFRIKDLNQCMSAHGGILHARTFHKGIRIIWHERLAGFLVEFVDSDGTCISIYHR